MELLPGIYQIKSALECKRLKRARRILTPFIAEHPDDPDAVYLDGLTYFYSNDAESARSRWEYASILSPSHKGAQRGLQQLESPAGGDYRLIDDDLNVDFKNGKTRFNPFRLLFRPKKFFSVDVVYSRPVIVLLLLWLIGFLFTELRLMGMAERMLQQGTAPDKLPIPFVHSWNAFWYFMIPVSLFAGFTMYVFYGILSRIFYRICGVRHPDLFLLRRVLIYPATLFVVLSFAVQVIESFIYPNPLHAMIYYERNSAWDWLGFIYLLLLISAVWSSYIFYRGVRCCFTVGKWRLRFFTFLLPSLVLMLALVALTVQEETYYPESPNVETLLTTQQQQYSLDYPDNWLLTVNEYDDSIVTIEPEYDDAYITFTTYNEPIDVKATAVEELGYLDIGKEYIGLNPFEKWGNYTGFGYFMDFEEDGVTYKIEVFAATGKNAGFSVIQLCEESIENQMYSGFTHIQDSFAFKDVQSATPVE